MIQVRWQGPDRAPVVASSVPIHPSKVILREVAERHGLTVEELIAPVRTRRIAHARQEAMWLMRKTTSLSFPEIARRCGLKDHTSVLHGVRAHEARLDALREAA